MGRRINVKGRREILKSTVKPQIQLILKLELLWPFQLCEPTKSLACLSQFILGFLSLKDFRTEP